jgi:hypothetical protein
VHIKNLHHCIRCGIAIGTGFITTVPHCRQSSPATDVRPCVSKFTRC